MTGSLVQAQTPVQKIYKWKVVSVYPANVPIFNNGIEKFARDVKTESNGQLDIKVYAAKQNIEEINKSLEPSDVFNAVSEGTVEMGFGAPNYWTKEVPGCELMYAVPFGLDAAGMHAWLYSGGGLKLWKELFEPHNILPFPIGNTGDSMGGWFDRKIEKIEDFKGLNIRMSDFCSKIYSKLGAKERWMFAGEASDAFYKKEIDVIICQGPYNDQHHRFYLGPKYYYYPGWQEPGGMLALIINKKAWDSLPADLQEKIEKVREKTYQFISNQFDSMNSRALFDLVEKEKVTLIEFPEPVLDQLKKLSQEVLEEEAAKNAQFKRVYEAFKKFKQENSGLDWRGNLYKTIKKRWPH
jgi:TRAP-type mannitol/chloroaromatic compound transport system substrate-binding protein